MTNSMTNLLYLYLDFNHIQRLINHESQRSFYFQISFLINSLMYLFHLTLIENRAIYLRYQNEV